MKLPLLLLAWSAACCIWSVDLQTSIISTLRLAACVALYYSCYKGWMTRKHVFYGITAIVLLNVVIGLLQYCFNNQIIPHGIIPAGMLSNKNLLASLIAPGALFFPFWWLAIPCVVMIYFTQCKAAVVAIAGMILWRVAWIKKLYMIPIVFTLMIMLLWFGRGIFKTNSFICRVEFAANSIYIIAQHPFRGCGPGMYGPIYHFYGEPVVTSYSVRCRNEWPYKAHNDFLQAAVECGIPYAITMFVMWLIWTRNAAKRGDWRVSCALFGLGLFAIMDFPLQMQPHTSMFWALGGLAMQRQALPPIPRP